MMSEEEKEKIITLASRYIGDREIAEAWFENYNVRLQGKPSESDYKDVKNYLLEFLYGP